MRKLAISNFLIYILICSTSHAAFDDIGFSARPMGMGGAFVAISNDFSSSSFNPAGLVYAESPELGLTRIVLIGGVVNVNYAGAILPIGSLGSLGANFSMLNEDSGIYYERMMCLSYSNKVTKKLSLGVTAKLLTTAFDESVKELDQYFEKTSVTGFTLDLGVLTKPLSGLSIGLSAQDLLPVSVSVTSGGEEKVPSKFRFGLALDLSPIADSARQPALKEVLKTTIISLETGISKEREITAIKLRTGIEAWFANRVLGLRAGYCAKKVQEMGSFATLGASVNVPISSYGLRVDYAMQIFGADLQERLAHRISIAFAL